MKKLALVSASVTYFMSAVVVFAQDANSRIQIQKPDVGYSDIATFINAAIRLVFIIGLLGVLAMMIWGGAEWIFSGGEKEAVGKARGRIVNALIGLAILAVAFAIANFAGAFLGINLLSNFEIPSPTNPLPSLNNPK